MYFSAKEPYASAKVILPKTSDYCPTIRWTFTIYMCTCMLEYISKCMCMCMSMFALCAQRGSLLRTSRIENVCLTHTYMFVMYMYMYVYVYAQIHFHVYVYAKTHIYVYLCTYVRISMCIYVRTCTCVYYYPRVQSAERTGRQPAGDISYRKSVIDEKCFAFTWKEKFEEPNKNTRIKFKDYAAEVFRDLRVLYGVHDHDYLCKLTHKYSDLARILVYTCTHIHTYSIAIGCFTQCVFILSVSLLFPLNLLSRLSHDHVHCAYISGHCSRFKCDQERERECVCVCVQWCSRY